MSLFRRIVADWTPWLGWTVFGALLPVILDFLSEFILMDRQLNFGRFGGHGQFFIVAAGLAVTVIADVRKYRLSDGLLWICIIILVASSALYARTTLAASASAGVDEAVVAHLSCSFIVIVFFTGSAAVVVKVRNELQEENS